MVPSMFFGKVPEAPKLHDYKEKEDNVKCDISESKMFYALKRYFESTGDDVLIIHSHDFLTKDINISELDGTDPPATAPRFASEGVSTAAGACAGASATAGAGASARELDGNAPPHEAAGEYYSIIW